MIQIYVGGKKIIISLAISHTFPFNDILECFPFHWCVNWITGQSWLHGGRWDWISGVESGAAWQRMDYSSSRATHQAFTLLSKDEADWIEPIGFIFFNSRRRGKAAKQVYTLYNACSINTIGQVEHWVQLARYLLIFLCNMTDMAELWSLLVYQQPPQAVQSLSNNHPANICKTELVLSFSGVADFANTGRDAGLNDECACVWICHSSSLFTLYFTASCLSGSWQFLGSHSWVLKCVPRNQFKSTTTIIVISIYSINAYLWSCVVRNTEYQICTHQYSVHRCINT